MSDAKDSVELFTGAEKNYMLDKLKSFTSAEKESNLPSDKLFQSDHHLSGTILDAQTKSIVLAPFNTTISDLHAIPSLPSEVAALIQSRACLQFRGRAAEVAKQYEVNNNAELDNGVYHEF